MKKILFFLAFLAIVSSGYSQQQHINIGSSANDGTGDPLRTAFDKINDNFDELFARPYGVSHWQPYGTNQIMPDPSTEILRYPGIPTYLSTSPSIGKLRAIYWSTTLKTLAMKIDGIWIIDDTISADNCHENYTWTTASAKDTIYIDSIKNLCGSFTVTNNGSGSQLTLISVEGLLFNAADKVVLNYQEWVKITPDSANSVFITNGNTVSDSANSANKANDFKENQTFEKGIIYTPMVVDSIHIKVPGIGIDSLTRIIIYEDGNDVWYTWSGGITCPIANGTMGQVITVMSISDGKMFIDHDLFILKDTNDFEMACGDNVTFMFVTGHGWIEIGRTDRPYDCEP